MSDHPAPEQPAERPLAIRVGDGLAELGLWAFLALGMLHAGLVTDVGKSLAWPIGAALGVWACVGLALGRWTTRATWAERLAAVAALWPPAWLVFQAWPLGPGRVFDLAPDRRALWEPVVAAGGEIPATLCLALRPDRAWEGAWQAAALSGVFLAALMLARHRGPARRMVWLLAIVAVVEGARGALGALALGDPRASGSLVNPNHYAALMTLVIPVLVAAILARRREEERAGEHEGRARPSTLLGALVLLALGGWALSLSRASLLLGGSVLAAWGVLEVGRSAVRSAREGDLPGLQALAAAVLVAALAGGLLVLGGGVLEDLGERLEFAEADLEARRGYWDASLAAWAETPTWGLGNGGVEAALTRLSRDAAEKNPVFSHNDWVQVLAEWGEVGAGVFAALLLAALAATGLQWWRDAPAFSARRWLTRRALLAGVLAVLVHATFDFHLRIGTVAACFLVALALLVARGSLHAFGPPPEEH